MNFTRREAFKTTAGIIGASSIGAGSVVAQSNSDKGFRLEPQFVVASDGTGDYEDLQSAYRVAQDGDVIGLKHGNYSFEDEYIDEGERIPDEKKAVTLVGDSRYTNVTFYGEIDMDYGLKDFYDITIEHATPDTVLQGSKYGVDTHTMKKCYIKTPIEEGNFKLENSTVSLDNDQKFRPSELTAVSVIFACNIDFETYEGALRLKEATGCRFEETLDVPPSGGNVKSSILWNGINAPGSSSVTFEKCVIYPDENGVAVNVNKSGVNYSKPESVGLVECDINGKIKTASENLNNINLSAFWAPSKIESCLFRTGNNDFDYFIDGIGAGDIIGNGFIGADIRLVSDDSSDIPTVYDSESEIGNYYSEYDNEDENGDGIIDLPRPIPGEGKLTDQYPLASPPTGTNVFNRFAEGRDGNPEVVVHNVDLTPSSVAVDSQSRHILSFQVSGVSADDSRDEFTVEFPDDVVIEDYSDPIIPDFEYSNLTINNTNKSLTFSVNPKEGFARFSDVVLSVTLSTES